MISFSPSHMVSYHHQVFSHTHLIPILILTKCSHTLSLITHSHQVSSHTHLIPVLILTKCSHTLSLITHSHHVHALTYQCYPCMSSLTSGHSLPWCPTSPTDHELPEHSLTPTHLTTDHSHSPIVIPALLVLTKSLLSHTMSTHSC